MEGSGQALRELMKASDAEAAKTAMAVKEEIKAAKGDVTKVEAKVEGLEGKIDEITAMLQQLLNLSVPAVVEATDVQML